MNNNIIIKNLDFIKWWKKNNEFSKSRRKDPKSQGDRQQAAAANVFLKISNNKSTEKRNGITEQEHEELNIVQNTQRPKGRPPPLSSPTSTLPRQMEMGIDGAVNGIIANSILIHNDDRSTYAPFYFL